MQGRLGAFEDQQVARAEGDDAGADLRPDRAAAAGDEHALAADEVLEPLPVDLHGGAQQQVLDLERRELGIAHALAEARDAHQRQAEAAGAGEQHVRVGLRRQRARRRHEAADRRAALVEILDHLIEIGEGAEHRHAADRLAEIVGAVGQDALGLQSS